MQIKVYLKRDRRKRLEQGHPWVYRSEIGRTESETFAPDLSPQATPESGSPAAWKAETDLVQIVNHAGHFLAQGFYNPNSQITVRVLDYDEHAVIDETWFLRRIQAAWERRNWLIPGVRSCRAVYGEADFLPGLIVDKYEEVLVVQILSAGMDRRRHWIFSALEKVFAPKGIYERDDVPVRKLEGLEERSGFVGLAFETLVTIEENSLKIKVDLAEGQKTGYFFDQRENRARLQPLMTGWGRKHGITLGADGQPVDAKGRLIKNPFWDGAEVLDCFSHTGGFMLHACLYGAKKVTCLDISEKALQIARENALNNGFLHRTEFVAENAFDYLREQVQAGRSWDVVILDPPAFAKNRQSLPGALRGYKEINLQGMKLLRPGGILVSSSCSYHLSAEKFLAVIQEAAVDAKKILRLGEFRRAGLDHPVLLGSNETDYLKFAIFEVFDRR